ncbi:hypothetical protein D1AOALGA4SA_1902 [Olavius algarvensis Delta 1 endosymbiont]|nr:hypothetical protein D1AOALGA4SA_1902 [Olavius algarvensis Delta 1 endosymbiont]
MRIFTFMRPLYRQSAAIPSIPNTKLQINLKSQYSMTKTSAAAAKHCSTNLSACIHD